MLISRPPCLEINESFLQSKKLSDKCVCKIFYRRRQCLLIFFGIHAEFYNRVLQYDGDIIDLKV